MSVGVLVVKGAQYSGSAITAKLAIDQGREVFAWPGNITSKLSWGPNLLIKQEANLVQDWIERGSCLSCICAIAAIIPYLGWGCLSFVALILLIVYLVKMFGLKAQIKP